MSIERIKDSMRAAWMAGDFGVVAKTISGGAQAFVDRLAIPSGTRILDVACGTGNLAIRWRARALLSQVLTSPPTSSCKLANVPLPRILRFASTRGMLSNFPTLTLLSKQS